MPFDQQSVFNWLPYLMLLLCPLLHFFMMRSHNGGCHRQPDEVSKKTGE
ncbi:DUF2933 domain-containing protein [Acetonema longum]|uniref:DUF2933 domain-containing protein n=1 Tax=Acetonema longum DSM 6540 TaxID=1009370 RepID=F7NGM5_9FIRM|nr:DUF2933 domain-containing protein [Acetonema longum]EGO64829.1 hypothetical protein ALO_06065 [Acetonema longum DSM 6540]